MTSGESFLTNLLNELKKVGGGLEMAKGMRDKIRSRLLIPERPKASKPKPKTKGLSDDMLAELKELGLEDDPEFIEFLTKGGGLEELGLPPTQSVPKLPGISTNTVRSAMNGMPPVTANPRVSNAQFRNNLSMPQSPPMYNMSQPQPNIPSNDSTHVRSNGMPISSVAPPSLPPTQTAYAPGSAMEQYYKNIQKFKKPGAQSTSNSNFSPQPQTQTHVPSVSNPTMSQNLFPVSNSSTPNSTHSSNPATNPEFSTAPHSSYHSFPVEGPQVPNTSTTVESTEHDQMRHKFAKEQEELTKQRAAIEAEKQRLAAEQRRQMQLMNQQRQIQEQQFKQQQQMLFEQMEKEKQAVSQQQQQLKQQQIQQQHMRQQQQQEFERRQQLLQQQMMKQQQSQFQQTRPSMPQPIQQTTRHINWMSQVAQSETSHTSQTNRIAPSPNMTSGPSQSTSPFPRQASPTPHLPTQVNTTFSQNSLFRGITPVQGLANSQGTPDAWLMQYRKVDEPRPNMNTFTHTTQTMQRTPTPRIQQPTIGVRPPVVQNHAVQHRVPLNQQAPYMQPRKPNVQMSQHGNNTRQLHPGNMVEASLSKNISASFIPNNLHTPLMPTNSAAPRTTKNSDNMSSTTTRKQEIVPQPQTQPMSNMSNFDLLSSLNETPVPVQPPAPAPKLLTEADIIANLKNMKSNTISNSELKPISIQILNQLNTLGLPEEIIDRNKTTAAGKLSRDKNRENSILPFDTNRVLLSNRANDYINCSRISTGSPNIPTILAGQIPFDSNDLWSMIWNEKV